MENKKRKFSGEKLHKITISSVVLALALLDIVPVWGVTSEHINSLSNNDVEDIELVEDLDVEKDLELVEDLDDEKDLGLVEEIDVEKDEEEIGTAEEEPEEWEKLEGNEDSVGNDVNKIGELTNTEEEVKEEEVKEEEELTKTDKETNKGKGLLTTTYGTKLKNNLTNSDEAMVASTMTTTSTYKMATDEDFSGTSNGSFRYIGTDEYVEIPHVIKGVNVTSYKDMFNGTSVKGVASTNNNVTDMRNMFQNSKATSLDVSNLDTSSVEDMGSMFYSSQATSIDLSSFDTSKVRNMSQMFYLSRATSLDLSSFDTSSVEDMRGMFRNSQATSIDLSSFDTSSVEDMSYMFYYSKATSLDVGNFDTSGVTTMGYMFNGSQATSLDVSNFDTSIVEDMSYMFVYSQATSLDVSNFDTSKVTTMAGMFQNSQATSLDLSSFDTSKVTTMSNMFLGSQATSIDVSSFDTSNVTDMINMFGGLKATNLDLSNFNTSNVTTMMFMFRDSQVPSLDLSSFDTSSVRNMGNMFRDSQSTIGYARTQADADKLNSSSNKPTSLTFYIYEEDAPTVTITGNPTSWTNQNITLTFNATDVNGVKRVQSPDGTWVNVSSITHTVTSNGTYTFKAEDNIGNTGTYSVTVNRIDKTLPTITLGTTGNPDDWFRDYELELEVITSDTLSGVKQVTLPDGTVVTGQELDTLIYKVTDNGSYEFIVEDNAGNKATYTEEVTMLEKEFSVKVTDTGNKPLTGAEFELYRDGEVVETVVSDSSGLVEFGTVYTSGDYEIRQTRVPEGYRLNNNILEVDVADDDINITNYHQSEVLPSTGTRDTLILLVMGLATISVITVTHKKRRKLIKEE